MRRRHQRDLVLLLSIAAHLDVRAMAPQRVNKDRERLRSAIEQLVTDDHHRASRAAANIDDARDTVRRLLTRSWRNGLPRS